MIIKQNYLQLPQNQFPNPVRSVIFFPHTKPAPRRVLASEMIRRVLAKD